MKLAVPILFVIAFLGALEYFALEGARRRGFDMGRADVMRQLQSAVSRQDSQWVETGMRHAVVNKGVPEWTDDREYTNRFFTNWTLRVRSPTFTK